MYLLRVSIGSLDCLGLLSLSRVIFLVFVVQHSIGGLQPFPVYLEDKSAAVMLVVETK